MVDVSTQNTVIVGCSFFDPAALQIAKDFVSGYFGEYLFFQYSQDDYVLIYDTDISIDETTGNFITGDSFKVFEIGLYETSSPVVHNDTFSASVVDIGSNTGIQSITGDIVRNDSETVQQWLTYRYTVDNSIEIQHSAPIGSAAGVEYVVYSSIGDNPRLIDSAALAGFFSSFVLSLIGVSFLIFSIFKRVK